MAESVNRTVVIDGEDDGLAAMLQGIQSATEDMGQTFARVMEKNSAAIDQMVRSMDGLLERMEKVQRSAGSGGGGGGRAGFAGGMVGGGMMGGIAGGVGAGLGIASFMGIGAMVGTAFSEGRKLDDARHMIMAISGAGGIDKTVGEGRDIGVSTSDLFSYQAEMMRMRGESGAGDRSRVLRTLNSERAYGLGEGETMGLHGFARSGGEEPAMVMARIFDKAKDSQLWNVKVDGKGEIQGFATLGEKMQQVTSMTTSMLRGSANADSGKIVDILSAFGSVGVDELSGSRALDSINALDQSIRNPSNDFMDAEIKTSLAQANPSMSAFELKKLQQQGIYGEGSLHTILSSGVEKYGNVSEEFIDQITGGGMSLDAIRALVGALRENPDMFEGKGGSDIDTVFAKFNKQSGSRATRVTGNTAQVEARSQDTLAATGLEVIEAFSDKIKSMLDDILAWVNDGSLEKAGEVVKETLDDVEKTAKLITEQGPWEALKKAVKVLVFDDMSVFGVADEDKDKQRQEKAKRESIYGTSSAAEPMEDAKQTTQATGGSKFFSNEADYQRFMKNQADMATSLDTLVKLVGQQ